MTRFEQIQKEENNRVLVASHRALACGNIPPNTIVAFRAGIRSGADVIECDVSKMADGTLIMFHPGTERQCTSFQKGDIARMTFPELQGHFYHSCTDGARTQYSFVTLDDALECMRDQCYINLDKCWDCLPEIMQTVRRHGMEEQILLKSNVKTEADLAFLDQVEALAPDVRYMPVYYDEDRWTEAILRRKVRFWGVEAVFKEEDNVLASREWIDGMHKHGIKLWVNAIVFDYRRMLAGGHTDDLAVSEDPDGHWGWMCDRGFDIIQTDFPTLLRDYLRDSGKSAKAN